jgi:hypothetical protein
MGVGLLAIGAQICSAVATLEPHPLYWAHITAAASDAVVNGSW